MMPLKKTGSTGFLDASVILRSLEMDNLTPVLVSWIKLFLVEDAHYNKPIFAFVGD
jgi:hypothetical protein